VTLIKKEFQWGKNRVCIETGEIARQANGAVMVNMDDTVVQVTVVEAKSTVERDFFSLDGRLPGEDLRGRHDSRWLLPP